MREASVARIRRFVGAASPEQLRYVDSFLGEEVAVFLPVGGPCYFALSPRHAHPSHLFVLPFDDETRVEIGGRIVRAEHGRLLCLSAGVPHTELPSDAPPRYVAVMIGKTFFERQMFPYPAGGGRTFRGEAHDAPRELLGLLKRFMVEAGHEVPGRDAVLHGLSLEICHSVLRSIWGVAPAGDAVSSRIEVDRAIQHLHAHLGRKITVADMAGVAHMAPSHFARVFRRETGETPVAYLARIRLERVKKLLLAGDKNITEIALACGFGSSSYLSACFLKRFQIPPSAYCTQGRIPKTKGGIPQDRRRPRAL